MCLRVIHYNVNAGTPAVCLFVNRRLCFVIFALVKNYVVDVEIYGSLHTMITVGRMSMSG